MSEKIIERQFPTITNDAELEAAQKQYEELCDKFAKKRKMILNRYGDQDYYDATELIAVMADYARKKGNIPYESAHVDSAGIIRSPSTAETGETISHFQCFVCGKHDPIIRHNLRIYGSIERNDADAIGKMFTYSQTLEGYTDWWAFMIMACPEHVDQLYHLAKKISATQSITRQMVQNAINYKPKKPTILKFKDDDIKSITDTPEKIAIQDHRLNNHEHTWTLYQCVDSVDPYTHQCYKCGKHTKYDNGAFILSGHITENRVDDIQKFFAFKQMIRISMIGDKIVVIYACADHTNDLYKLRQALWDNQNFLTKALVEQCKDV